MEYRNLPTIELIDIMNKASGEGKQTEVNMYAYELACRLYVPFSDVSFDDILLSLGYVNLKEEKVKNMVR